jgi:WD40 repeat protein
MLHYSKGFIAEMATLYVRFSDDGTKVSGTSSSGQIEIFDSRTGTPLGQPSRGRNRKTITCYTFSPDGCYVSAGSADGIVRVWDVASTTLPAKAPLRAAHQDMVSRVAVAHSGS